MNEVELWDSEARVGSLLVSQGLEREHEMVKKLVTKYQDKFEDFSTLKVRKLKSTGGRAANEYLLDEDQFMFLGTLLKNTEKVVEFKFRIISQFKKCRLENEALRLHKERPEYQITRDAGKIVRKRTTDVMQKFIIYAETQGSKNAGRYYSNITRMLNGLMFIVQGKFKNVRELMTTQQLMTVSSAEQIIDRGLQDGMSRKKYYKEIYIEVRAKVELFAELHGQSEVISKQLATEEEATG